MKNRHKMKQNSRKPKVSILIPAYNAEAYVENCICSVINQTLQDIEIICIDDGSTDRTSEIMDYYAQKDSRIKVIHKKNSGYGHSMNLGIKMSKGEYLGIVESDDYIENNTCEKLYTIAKEQKVEIIKANFSRFLGEGLNKKIEKVPLTEKKDFYNRVINPKEEMYVFNFTMNIVTGLYKRDFLVNNNILFNETPGAAFQDNGFWIKTFLLAERLYLVDEYFYRCRRDNPNSSVKGEEKAFVVVKEFDLIHEWMKLDKELYDCFIKKFIYLQCIGYFSVYTRSSIAHKLEFILFFSKRYTEYLENGLIDKSYYGPIVYKKLMKVISNPIEFYVDDANANKSKMQIWKNEELNDVIKKYMTCLERLREAERDIAFYQVKRDVENIHYINSVHNEYIKNESPIVSVIIPVYNMENYIEETLESVVNQTLGEIEIICVDDGSTDGSLQKIINYAKYDHRFLIYSIKNSGAGNARNLGLEKSKGRYVVFIDGDDIYPNNETLKYLTTKIEEENVVICGGGVAAFENGTILEGPEYYTFEKEEIREYIDYQADYGYTRYIYNLEFLKENDIYFPNYLRFQDPPFFVKAMICAKKFKALDEIVYLYRKHHKKVAWNSEKCVNLLQGCYDIIVLACENNMQRLLDNVLERINTEYVDIILTRIDEADMEVLQCIVKISSYLSKFTGDNKCILEENWYKVYEFIKQKYKEKLNYSENERIRLNTDNLELRRKNQKLSNEIDELKRELKMNCETISDLNYSLYHTRISFTYKIGRVITYIPRKIRELIKR